MFRKADDRARLPPVHRRRRRTCRAYKNPDGIERGQCTYCGFCERFGCEVGAKADPTVTVLPVAMKTGKFKIINYANAFADEERRQDRAEHPLLRQHGPRPGAARRHHRARRLRLQQRAPAARVEARHAVRPGHEHRRRRQELRLPDRRRRRDRVVRRPGVRALHGRRRALVRDRRLQRRQLRPHRARLHGRRQHLGGQSGARPIQSLSTPPGTPAFGSAWKPAIKQNYKRRPSASRRRIALLPVPLPRPRPSYRDKFGQPLSGSPSTGRRTSARWWRSPGQKTLQIMQEMAPTSARAARVAPAALRHRRTSPPTTRAERSWAPTRDVGREQLPADVGCRTSSSSAPATSRRTPASTRPAPSAPSRTARPKGSSTTTVTARGDPPS